VRRWIVNPYPISPSLRPMKFLVRGNEDAAFSDAQDHGGTIAGHRKLIGLLGGDQPHVPL